MDMRCPVLHKENTEIILDYCARTLSPEMTLEFERHMAVCGDCRVFASSQQVVWSALDEWEAAPVSADFDRKLYARIEEHENSGWWKKLAAWTFATPFSWASSVAPIAMACVTLAAAVMFYMPVERPVGPEARQNQSKVESTDDVYQVERTLDDIEMFKQLAPPVSTERM
jgi:hypothetical protein